MFVNTLHRWLSRNFAAAQRQRRPANAKPTQRRPNRFRPMLEALEDRTVPTVLFAPQFGNESLLQDGGQRLNSPAVYVVLWGSSWDGIATPAAVQVYGATSGVVTSHYLDGLAQYGVTTNASIKSTVYDNTPDPASGFSQQSLIDEIKRLIANNQLPNPANTPNMIVDMVTAPGISSNLKQDAAGYNNALFSGKNLYCGFIWNGTTNGPLSLRDACSLTFSHQMAEVMTDPGGQGYEVKKGTSWPGTATGTDQIGDFEGTSYQYRLGDGTLVQPYWSGALNSPYPNQWLVTDGNAQTMNVKPNWTSPKNGSAPTFINYDVTVNGGQLAGPKRDYLIVGRLASGPWPSDLAVVLNNELFLLDSVSPSGRQQLGTLTANISNGLVHINGSPIMTGITINTHSGTEVDVASNAFVLAAVTINDASTVSIGPSENNAGRTHVAVNSPHVRTTLIMDDRTNAQFNGFDVEDSLIQCNGFDVTYSASQIQDLFVLGGTGGSHVSLGSFSPLDALPANITMTGGGTSVQDNSLSVNGEGSTDNLYEIDKGTVGAYLQRRIGRHILKILTNQIRYSNLGLLRVFGSAGGNTFSVNNTHAFTTILNTGSGSDKVLVNGTTGPLWVSGDGGLDTVNIGSNGTVRNIGNTLTVVNPGGFSAVNVDDSADNGARTAIVYNTGILHGPNTVIDGLTPGGDIVLRGAELSSLLIRTGGGGNTFRIHDTPYSLTPGGLTTTLSSGAGSDTVTVDGTTGALAVDAQEGTNVITVGSATVGLDRINGPINVSGLGVSNTLSIDDTASTVSHVYVIDRNFVQRLDKARIGYQHMSSLNLRAGAQSDHIIVQNTMPPVGFGTGTTITSGGDDRIDVSRTTGILSIHAGGSSVIEVGNALNPLDNIQGFIAVFPSAANSVTLSLNDQAATTSEQLDVTANGFGPRFQRSGAADIQVLFSPLFSFQWQGGNGGNIVNVKAQPAVESIFRMGDGGDVLNDGTAANKLVAGSVDIGSLTVIGGKGVDQLLIQDQGTTTPQRYELFVSPFAGSESRGTIRARDAAQRILNWKNIVFEHVKSVTLNAGSGGNSFKIAGTPAATSVLINTGAGNDTVDVGSYAVKSSLADIRGPLTLDGQGGLNQVTFNDQGTTTLQYYNLVADQLTRTDANSVADMAPISFAAIDAISLNASSGGSTVFVQSTAAGTSTTVNGQPGASDTFAVGFAANTNKILGPVIFFGQAADNDFAYYYDYFDPNPQTFNVSTAPGLPQDLLVERTGAAPVTFNDLSQVIFSTPLVGGSTVNIKAVPAQMFLNMEVGNGDTVTLASLAPNLGGTLANIKGGVNIGSYSPNDAVTLVLDDSGNADTTPRHVMLTPRNGPFDDGNHIEGFAPNTVDWNLGANASIALLGGAADEIFSLQPFVAATPLTIVGGTGSNTLNYSSYTTDVSVNLQTGTATDLAGIKDPNTGRVTIQNVIGGSGNDTLIAGADRSILIGGGGADHLFGGSREDILIGGTTDYTQPNLNAAAFDAILQEWNRTDLGFDDRMSDLSTGTNPTGVAAKNVIGGTAILLNSTTVHDDLAADVLTGGTGRDWYFIGATDLITNQKPGDAVTMV